MVADGRRTQILHVANSGFFAAMLPTIPVVWRVMHLHVTENRNSRTLFERSEVSTRWCKRIKSSEHAVTYINPCLLL
jgi:hypothetical protein